MKYKERWEELKTRKDAESLCCLLRDCPVTAAVIGLDGRPEARPVSLQTGAGDLTFSAPRNNRLYAELSRKPVISLLCRDPDGDALVRIGAKICFTDDEAADREGVSRFVLTEADVELIVGEAEHHFALPDPAGLLRGVTIRKKTELRDRLSKLLIRREEGGAGSVSEDLFAVKLFDGALLLFAESAKTLWPRMDVQPIERAAIFETWDEREAFVRLAKQLIGNAVIDKPEDMTWWLNPETLMERYRAAK